MLPTTILLDVRIGKQSCIGPQNTITGLYKTSVNHAIFVTKNGLTGDFQADKRAHGGFEKAIYHYPYENYTLLKKAYPQLQEKFNMPCVGENVSSKNLTEKNVHIGDIFTIGESVVQVSQPRMPCWKLQHAIGNAYIGNIFISQSITGWYFRVLQEGNIQKMDKIVHIERLKNSYSIHQVWEKWIMYKKKILSEKDIPNIPGLSHQWQY